MAPRIQILFDSSTNSNPSCPIQFTAQQLHLTSSWLHLTLSWLLVLRQICLVLCLVRRFCLVLRLKLLGSSSLLGSSPWSCPLRSPSCFKFFADVCSVPNAKTSSYELQTLILVMCPALLMRTTAFHLSASNLSQFLVV